MIPQVVTVRWRRRDGAGGRLWIPLLPLALVLSPVLLFAVLVAVIACAVCRISPTRALSAAGQVLCALPGTRIDIEQSHRAVLLTIR